MESCCARQKAKTAERCETAVAGLISSLRVQEEKSQLGKTDNSQQKKTLHLENSRSVACRNCSWDLWKSHILHLAKPT